MKKTTRGFTIVELLIVIVVIAILAAISIVAYSGIQARSNESVILSDLSSFRKRLEILKIESTNETYPASLSSESGFGFSKGVYRATSAWNVYYCPSPGRLDYAFGVVSKDNKWYVLRASGGITTGAGSVTSTTVCDLVGSLVGSVTNGYDGSTQSWYSWTD